MNSLFVLLLLLGVTSISCSEELQKNEGDKNKTNLTEFTDAAAILIDETFICSGSVLSPNLIITAAICLAMIPKIEASELSVMVGSQDRTKGQHLNVSNFIVHPNFRYYPQQSVLEHDIAVIQLNDSIRMKEDGGHVTPLKLAKEKESLDAWAGKKAAVVGWGVSGSREPLLKAVNVTVGIQKECYDYYLKLEPAPYNLTDEQLCSGPSEGLCIGESGAGLRVKNNEGLWELIGITGPEVECPKPKRPEIYTRISSYRAWLNSFLDL